MVEICLTADMEQDCPPFLNTWRGMDEGAELLLDLLDEEDVTCTFFTTGQAAAKFPAVIRRIVDRGHELACHGYSHTAFTSMDRPTAASEIRNSARELREFAPVTSFRAPYLRFPNAYLDLLELERFTVDSSQAKYKLSYYRPTTATSLMRVPASVTSSVLRLPRWVRETYLNALSGPLVLFVHPWEFVDLRRERLRLDCRFNTGTRAVECLQSIIQHLKHIDGQFVRMRDLAS